MVLSKIILQKICLFILCISLIAMPFFSSAQTNDEEIDNLTQSIQEKQDAINSIKDSIGSYKEQIENLQDQADTLKNRLKVLNTGIQRAKKEIELTNLQIDETKLEIQELQNQIQFKEKQIDQKEQEIKEVLQKIDTLGEDYISNAEEESLGIFDLIIKFAKIIVRYDSWSAYAQTLENSKDINNLLLEKKNALAELKQEMEGKKTKSEEKKQSLENSYQQLEEKKMVLGDEVEAKNDLLEDTQANEEKYQALLKKAVEREQALALEVNQLQAELQNKLAALNRSNPFSTMIWPVPNKGVTCGFGVPGYYQAVHRAIDIRADSQTPVLAPADGVVIATVIRSNGACKTSRYSCDYTYVKIAHSDKIASLSLHLTSVTVSVGDEVKQGQIIGYSGGVPRQPGTGYFYYPSVPASTGPHLHFAVTECVEGSYLNPEKLGACVPRAINPLKYLP